MAASPPVSTMSSEEAGKFQADLATLTEKLAQLQNSQQQPGFVNGLRQETSRNGGDKVRIHGEKLSFSSYHLICFILAKTCPPDVPDINAREYSRQNRGSGQAYSEKNRARYI